MDGVGLGWGKGGIREGMGMDSGGEERTLPMFWDMVVEGGYRVIGRSRWRLEARFR